MSAIGDTVAEEQRNWSQMPWRAMDVAEDGGPEPAGASAISRRVSSATAGKTEILRTRPFFKALTRHIIPW